MMKGNLVRYLLMALAIEKVVQHFFVAVAFYSNFGDLRSQVAVDYRSLMYSGLVVGFLFIAAFYGLVRKAKWGTYLVAALALFDVFGEFVAQGTLMIAVPLSFIVAVVILLLAYIQSRTSRC